MKTLKRKFTQKLNLREKTKTKQPSNSKSSTKWIFLLLFTNFREISGFLLACLIAVTFFHLSIFLCLLYHRRHRERIRSEFMRYFLHSLLHEGLQLLIH